MSGCFPHSGEVGPYDGMMGRDEEMHSDMYEDGDICEGEVETYKEKVEKRKEDIDCVCNELKMATTMNYHKKLTVLCECVAGELKLHSEKLLAQYNRTLLHVALGLNNVEVAKVLIRYGTKELLLAKMIGKRYGGITALHLAIVNGRVEIVKTILEKIEDEDKKNYVNCQTYGALYSWVLEISSTVLGLCLWCGQEDLYGVLIDAGAELDAAENDTGNTAIHSLVLYSKENPELMIKMVDMVMTHDATRRWWCQKKGIPLQEYKFGPMHWKHLKKHLLGIPNKEGYTPLTLAARRGAPEILSHLLNINQVNKNTIWTYGPSSSSLYDLSETDPLVVEDGTPAVLDIIVYDASDDILPVIASEPIHTLINAKWRSHRVIYYIWLLYHLTLMTVFTWWAVEKPIQDIHNITGHDFLPSKLSDDENLAVEWVIIIAASFYLITQSIDIATSLVALVQYRLRRSSTGYYKAPWSVIFRYDDFRVILITFSVSTLVASILNHEKEESSDIFYCLALTCGWYYMLAFLRTFKSFSYYTIMVHRIIFSDILRFAFVFAFILLGFSAGNIVIFATSTEKPDQVESFDKVMYSLLRLMIGLDEWDIVGQARSKLAASIVFVCFVVLTTILLLNMLIASMTDTYAAITDRYLALTCMTIERWLMPLKVCRKYHASTYLQDSLGKQRCAILVSEVQPHMASLGCNNAEENQS